MMTFVILLIVLFPFGRHAVHSRCKAVRICILKTAAIPHIITQFSGCVNPNAANAVQYNETPPEQNVLRSAKLCKHCLYLYLFFITLSEVVRCPSMQYRGIYASERLTLKLYRQLRLYSGDSEPSYGKIRSRCAALPYTAHESV